MTACSKYFYPAHVAEFFEKAILKKDKNYFSTNVCSVKFIMSPMFLSLHFGISVDKQDIYTYLTDEEHDRV